MGLQYKGGFCKTCDAPRKLERKGANHILHLLLSVITFGWWLIIWALLSLPSIGGWRCSMCGSRVGIRRLR
jgi:hypothetical protein